MGEQSIPALLERAASRTLRVRLGKRQAGQDYSALVALAARWPEIKAAVEWTDAALPLWQRGAIRLHYGSMLHSELDRLIAAAAAVIRLQRAKEAAGG